MSRRITAAALATLAGVAPATALADPTVGVAFGKTEAASDATSGADANTSVGLFARGRVSRVVSFQGEIGKIQTGDGGSTIRTFNAAAIIDLARGPLVPFALLGAGLDTVSLANDYNASASSDDILVHAELGAGIEYRFRGGFVLGADVRVGTRTDESPQPVYTEPYSCPNCATAGAARYVVSTVPADGQYRSARLTLGVHF
jgi:hypothetical protein